MSLELLPFQQMRMDAIARSAIEIVAGPEAEPDAEALEQASTVMAEALRKSGVPIVTAAAEYHEGALRIVMGLAPPAGFG